ncbi:Tripartite tricarboxylate transporter TctB family protein [Caloramator quimbayensis]|uniref:Tripartite tricarboxylate transporter TctB family protein n=1 Tax=Caloramator quimbayensis TaxID=1147123 RepID=A0A1T4X628_9CLOT|nr:tripartite tricarboxylate transporter TctB family protein [Caloramator quimbayensis]SKA84515.1 Tripartite tricarboxylate transporter TctB family protein [Caloramator quimbayensis]
MFDLFKIKIVYSKSHWVMPKIIIGVLIILGIIILIQESMKAKRENRPLFNFKGKRFFVENYDKLKLFGSIALLIIYIYAMKFLGFIFGSIIVISLFNILYSPKKDKKSILICIAISVIETLILWFVFGYLFEITLP